MYLCSLDYRCYVYKIHIHKVCVIPILFWMCTKIPIPIPILFVNVYTNTNTNTNSIRSTHIPIPIPQLYTKFVYWYFCAKNLWVLAATERLKTFQAIACCFEHVLLIFYRLVILTIIILNNILVSISTRFWGPQQHLKALWTFGHRSEKRLEKLLRLP